MAIGQYRVQVTRRSDPADGGEDDDALGGFGNIRHIQPQDEAIESAGVYLQDASNRDENVYIARSGDDAIFRDLNNTTPVTLSDLIAGTEGITEGEHPSLRQLIHLASVGLMGGLGGGPYYFEVSPVGSFFPTSMAWYTTTSKTTKVYEVELTYTGPFISTAHYIVYQSDGVTIEEEATDSNDWSSSIAYPKVTRTYGAV